MGRLFGTDGARGVAITELTCEMAMQIGRAAALVLTKEAKHRAKIFIGKDTRISSDILEAALCAGICSVGAEAVKLGVVPTPAVAYLVRTHGADAGVMISASHNSVEFNGIKLFAATGYKLPDATEEEIEALILDHPEKSSCSPISVSVRSLSTPTPRRTISLTWQAVLQQTAPASVWRWTAQTAALPPQQRNSLHVWVQKYICSAHLRTAQTSTKTAALPIWKTSWHM